MDANQNPLETSTNEQIKVSVVIPIYNAYDYLGPALDSVVEQSESSIEIICIDDGSTDRSLELVKKYQEKDGRIRIVTETNAGPGLARNNGLKRARGEYVVFLDADDFFEPDLISVMYSRAKSDDLDIVIADYDIYNCKKGTFSKSTEEESGKIYDGGVVTSKNEHPDEILLSTTGSAWNKMFRRSFLSEKNIQFPETVKMFEDVYFTVGTLAFAERVGKCDRVLIHHRIYNEQTRAQMYKKYYPQVPEVYLRIKEFLMKGGMYQPLERSFLNLSASRCYYIYNLLWSDAKKNFWGLLHSGYAEKLGWCDRCKEAFFLDAVCDFSANVQMYTHKQYLKRTSRGMKLRLDKLKNHIKRNKFANGIKRLFGYKDSEK